MSSLHNNTLNFGESEANVNSQQLIEVIKRQTDYNDEIILQKLNEHNNNIVEIIREYMSKYSKNREKKQHKSTTTNQQVFTEIRKLMDDASEAYRKKKEKESEH